MSNLTDKILKKMIAEKRKNKELPKGVPPSLDSQVYVHIKTKPSSGLHFVTLHSLLVYLEERGCLILPNKDNGFDVVSTISEQIFSEAEAIVIKEAIMRFEPDIMDIGAMANRFEETHSEELEADKALLRVFNGRYCRVGNGN